MKISNLAISSLGLLLVACAGTESYQNKMERYQARAGEKILVPEIKSIDFASTTPKMGRFPASISTEESNLTNKKLYFLSLYSQYESFKSYSNNSYAPELQICPSFHTGLISYQEKYSSKIVPNSKVFTYNLAEFKNTNYVSTHPELLLPITKDALSPKVIDIINSMNDKITAAEVNEIVKNAVDIHLAKTFIELRELCTYGSSSNYYIYENLVTHTQSEKLNPSTASMNILLKTTLFSNRALLTSLSRFDNNQGRAIASEKLKLPFNEEFAKRLSVSWSNDYFNILK